VAYSIPYVFSLNYLGRDMALGFSSAAAGLVGAVQDALQDTYQSLTSAGGLRFPGDISDNYITFSPKQRGKKTKLTPTGGGGGGSITLPIPSNLSTGYNAQYDTGTGLNALGSYASQVASGETEFSKEAAGAAAIEQAKAIGLSTSPEVASALGMAVAGKMGLGAAGIGAGVGAALGGAARGAAVGAGIAVNPHLAVIFSGVNFRTHSFQYKFSPRDAGESDSLKEIIKIFKLNMHPTIEGAAFFKYPNEFDIAFNSKNENFLFKFGTSVLSDFQINYNPDGGSYFHDNGAPVSVGLSLTFTEIDIITQEKINEGR
jgi:hypothetical protein